ncbi:hypothetical protein [Streptomyces sp.]|uniref:hypothetical protein n=1 Tax=Streptomyces sp. TaxID=1931 RepID=UPI0028125F7E|nr:hypothetical protein [Streptomyces sp.]
MSRETDTPSSGPDGRGGAAYPSGTPPYGIPAIPDEGTGAGRPAARPKERKTETTLTTRIRINIPGSRPIPPVVVRKPVADTEAKGTTDAEAPTPSSAASTGAAEPPAEPDRSTGPDRQPAEEKPASDWFAPRKSAPVKGGPGGGSANGSGTPSGSGAAAAGGPAAGTAPAGAPGGARPGGGRPGGVVGSMNTPGGSRHGGTNGSGLPGATGGPVAPGHGGGTGSFDVTEALTGGSAGSGTRPGAGGGGGPRQDDPAHFTEDGPGGRNGQPGASGPSSGPGQAGQLGRRRPGGPNQGPAGPTTGPVTGDGPMAPPAGPGGPARPGGPAGPGAAGGQPHPGAAFDGQGGPGAPGGGLSDDTAILTPQQPVPGPGTPGYGARHANVSGHTVTSGIPVVPPGASFDAGAPADGPLRHTPPKLPEPVSPPPASSSKPPKKKGRNKVVLLGGAVVVLAGVAYGAGLLMNHSDVPKGTTVLGVDIGGTRDEAVKKLDQALDDRLDKPLKLSVGGKTVELEPDNAGLQLDTDATVGEAARSDYNPVSVIGSLFGNHRVVEPVMPVDEEKLQAALEDAVGGSGSVVEGTIEFESGKAVPVYPKAGKGIDVAQAVDVVEEAYRTQVETGASAPVNVPTTTRQPEVSKAEVDRMMKEFAEPAMSANVTVQTDAAHSVPMSPQNSLWKFLRVEAVDGKLVDKPDLAALKKLYGQAFDDVLITRGNGEKTPVTPQDVYGALRPALTSTTDRVAVIDTDPS